MKRLALVAAAAAFVALGFVSTPASAATTPSTHEVGVVNFGFKSGVCPTPTGDNSVTIVAGDTVVWKNCSDTGHTITADDMSFDKPLNAGGADVAIKFSQSGPPIFYHCKIHDTGPNAMHGSILVQPAPASTTLPTQPPLTTAKPTTTVAPTTSTSTTQTTVDLDGLFDGSSTTSSSSTTSTTTEESSDDDGGSSSGLVVALLALAIAGVGAGAYLVWRRVQQTA